MNGQLKPCPFCGEQHVELVNYDTSTTHRERVSCPTCHIVTVIYDARGEAIEAWNTRYERTCHDVSQGGGVFMCSTCGAFTKLGAVMDCCGSIPQRYCPNCGARIVEHG